MAEIKAEITKTITTTTTIRLSDNDLAFILRQNFNVPSDAEVRINDAYGDVFSGTIEFIATLVTEVEHG